MTWTKLDDSFCDDPRILAVGNEGAGAYARMLSYCGKHLTDGELRADVVHFIARKRTVSALVREGLLEENGTKFVIPDFLAFNPSKEQVEERRQARSQAGKRGAVASARVRGKG